MQLPSLLRRNVAEAAPVPSQPERIGYVPGVPMGGATKSSPARGTNDDRRDRGQYMRELLRMYLECPWCSISVDAIAKTITAGGVDIVPDIDITQEGATPPKPTMEVMAVQDLFDWCNPDEDIVQLCNRLATDLGIFGDAYVEVTWQLGRPIALWTLDVSSMTVQADEHGVVTGYLQKIDGNRTAQFEPHEVVHIKLDSPAGGLYGIGPTQKAETVVTEWLFASALVMEVFRQGDPPKLHVDWPLQLQDTEIERLSDMSRSRNRGLKNIGNPFHTKGGGKVQELQLNRITEYLAAIDQKRDEIVGTYHVPPAEAGIIESGNIGGGTGSSQFKTFKVIACAPIAAVILEKLTSVILRQGFGIEGWRARFGEYDWRDDKVVDDISSSRLRDGRWTLNRARAEIGEPPVPGGDQAILVDRQNMVVWDDVQKMSAATVSSTAAKGAVPSALDTEPDSNNPAGKEWQPPSAQLRESWQRNYERRRRVRKDLDG